MAQDQDESCSNKVNDRPKHTEVQQGVSVCTLVGTVHRMMGMSCRRVSQLLCCSTDTDAPPCDTIICQGKNENRHREERHSAAAAATWSPPSTILIVNISNSTLIDCVIGNEACAPTVAEKQPLMQGTIQDLHDPSECNCSRQSIQIDSSNLSCVIIGDNNHMQVEQSSE